MKSVEYSESLKKAKDLYERARQATQLLEEVLGQSANLVSAEWDRSKDAAERDLLVLRISDWSGSASAAFAPAEMRDTAYLGRRLNRLWGDLLQIRSHKLLDELLETSSSPEK